jgi:hypothetical protein
MIGASIESRELHSERMDFEVLIVSRGGATVNYAVKIMRLPRLVTAVGVRHLLAC